MSTIGLFKSQLLWGNDFLIRYQRSLDALYYDSLFMNLIEEIRQMIPYEENAESIEYIKNIAKTTIYNRKAAYDFPPLKEIAEDVAHHGCAKNSAYISVYLAMRIYQLSGVVPAIGQNDILPNHVNTGHNDMDFRLKWPAEYRCEDGHYVRSKNEALVDNWLYHHGIVHAYEKAVFSEEAMYCSDFYLPKQKVFVEVWGMTNPEYEKRRKNKIRFYKENGFKLLEIKGNEIKNMDDKLSSAILEAQK